MRGRHIAINAFGESLERKEVLEKEGGGNDGEGEDYLSRWDGNKGNFRLK